MKHILSVLLLILTYSISYAQQFKAVAFTKTEGYKHQSIPEGVKALNQLAKRHYFQLHVTDQSDFFVKDSLEDVDVVIFLNTTGDVLNARQQAVLEDFVKEGKGFVGVHSASDTEYDWPWYRKLIGRMFVIHPAIQTAKLSVENSSFPGLSGWPVEQITTDEWYEFSEEEVGGLKYLLSIDENSYRPEAKWGEKEGNGMGDFHPVSWYHSYSGGRSFYTALGHMDSVYTDALFLQHLYGGIYWAATGKGIENE